MKPFGHRNHDVGGRPAGLCVRDEHEYAAWEKRVDALMMILWTRTQSITVDELRRAIEDLGREEYHSMGYYEKWMHSLTQSLLRRGLLTPDEIGQKMAELDAAAQGTHQ